ncbi:hypothetical protein NMY22_g2963 [Coprinellus aureogranulatus]|nr:hypothetical protein NMY22_g2963 [Coprinellus aureogranulatus]
MVLIFFACRLELVRGAQSPIQNMSPAMIKDSVSVPRTTEGTVGGVHVLPIAVDARYGVMANAIASRAITRIRFTVSEFWLTADKSTLFARSPLSIGNQAVPPFCNIVGILEKSEVVGLIVDDIWGSEDDTRTLSSLALVAKCFTAACQERLWRIVKFRSGASLEDSTRSLKQAKVLRSSPHLGSYVQTLEFHVDRLEGQMSQGFIEELDCFAGALKMLGSVIDLRFVYRPEGNRVLSTLRLSTFPDAWREEILRIATNDCLRRLTLDKISGFPLEALRDALRYLEILSLRKFSYDGMRSTGRSLAEERSVAKLKALKCDSDSYRIFNSFVDPPLDSHFAQVACNFAVLEDLELWVNTFVGDHKILQQATRLRVLRLEGALKPPSSDALQAILKQINPSAFNTLTILALSLDHVSVENVILDPLMGACSDGFPAVKALRSFDLYIHLDSHSGRLSWRRAIQTLNAETRPSAWTELDNSLSVIEELQEVKMRILIEHREYGWLAVMRETAEKLHRHVLDTVYPAQLRKLCSKKEKGELEFEFAVESIAMEK